MTAVASLGEGGGEAFSGGCYVRQPRLALFFELRRGRLAGYRACVRGHAQQTKKPSTNQALPHAWATDTRTTRRKGLFGVDSVPSSRVRMLSTNEVHIEGVCLNRGGLRWERIFFSHIAGEILDTEDRISVRSVENTDGWMLP